MGHGNGGPLEEDLPRPLREAEGAVLRLGAEVPRPLQGLQVLADLIRRFPLQQAIGGQLSSPRESTRRSRLPRRTLVSKLTPT